VLNLHKLEIFAAVAQAGSFSGAAQRLLMTQPAVSQHVQDLEASLGTPLFTRGRRGVQLTEAGAALQGYTSEIFALLARAEEAVTAVKHLSEGQVRIGATPGAAVYLLPEWVQEFRSQYPQLSVVMRSGITSAIVDDLRAGLLDMAFIEGEIEGMEGELESLAVQEDEQLVIVGRKHPWWARTGVAIEEMATQTFIVRQRNSQSRVWLEAQLAQRGVEPTIGAEFDALESIKRAVALGSCLAVLPEYVVREELAAGTLRALPVAGRPLVRTLKLVRPAALPWTPVPRAFVRSLQARLPALETVVGTAKA
jgi:DNA-binding transcriptional LysR family regulator